MLRDFRREVHSRNHSTHSREEIFKHVIVWNVEAHCCFRIVKWTTELQHWYTHRLKHGHNLYCRNLVHVPEFCKSFGVQKHVHNRGHHAFEEAESCLKRTHTETDKVRRSHRTTRIERQGDTGSSIYYIEAARGDPFGKSCSVFCNSTFGSDRQCRHELGRALCLRRIRF